MAAGNGRANFGPPGPAGAEKKNGWARARASRGREKERLDPGPGQARAIEKERTHYNQKTAATKC